MKKFSAKLKSFKFEYEFEDGNVAEFEFRDLNTKQIKEFSTIADMSDDERYELHLKLLDENIKGDKTLKAKMIEELEDMGNIYDFITTLQDELGKLKKRR